MRYAYATRMRSTLFAMDMCLSVYLFIKMAEFIITQSVPQGNL